MILKIKIFILALTLMSGLLAVIQSPTALADDATAPCPSGYDHPLDANGDPIQGGGCAKIKTNADCPSGKFDKNDHTKCESLGNDCNLVTGVCHSNPIVDRLNVIVNVMAGLVGVVVVGTIILGGVQFAAAGDKSEAVTAARTRITNGLIALVAFLFIYTFLQWLIPGGIFQ